MKHPANLILIGFMGTGKSVVGPLCATRLGYRFCDADTEIEKGAGKSIPAIFRDDGEAGFRKLEREVIRTLTRHHRIIVATGGGAPLHPGNASRMRASGLVVLLRASPDIIVQRIGDPSARPLLASACDVRARVESLLSERAERYLAAAHCSVDTSDLTPEEVAQAVLHLFQRQRAGAH